MITFEPLWKTLKEKKITTYRLIYHHNISKGLLDNLKHNRSITLKTLNDLCELLDCDITDIIKYTKDTKPNE